MFYWILNKWNIFVLFFPTMNYNLLNNKETEYFLFCLR